MAIVILLARQWRTPLSFAPSPEAERALSEIEIRLQQGRADDAIAIAETQLAREPRARGLHYALGTALAAKQEYGPASEEFRAELAGAPDHLDSYVRLAVVLSELERHSEAIDTLREAIARLGGSTEVLVLLAHELRSTGEQAEAERILVENEEKNDADAWNELGGLYADREQLDLAVDAFRRALVADPDHIEATFQLGRTLIRLGKEKEGQRYLGRHAELERQGDRLDSLRRLTVGTESTADDLVKLARYQLLQRDLDGAIASFRSAIEKDRTKVDALVGLGQALLESGRPPEAARWLTQAVEQAPDHADAHFFLGLARLLSNDAAGGEQALAHSRELSAWGGREYLFFGNVLASTGALADAELAFRRSLELGPEIPEARYKLGLVLHASGRSTQARPELERFVELEPRDPRGPLLLGVVLHHAGDVAEADLRFEQALDRLEVTSPARAAFDAMIADLRALPGGPAAVGRLEAVRGERAKR